jgi:hypothetical protein
MLGRGDPDIASGPVAKIAERREFGTDTVQRRSERGEQSLAGLRRRDVAGRPSQKPNPKSSLKPSDRVAQSGLRSAEFRSSPGEILFVGHSHERVEINQFLASHS